MEGVSFTSSLLENYALGGVKAKFDLAVNELLPDVGSCKVIDMIRARRDTPSNGIQWPSVTGAGCRRNAMLHPERRHSGLLQRTRLGRLPVVDQLPPTQSNHRPSAGDTHQTTLPTSSATSSAPVLSNVTPTGRPLLVFLWEFSPDSSGPAAKTSRLSRLLPPNRDDPIFTLFKLPGNGD